MKHQIKSIARDLIYEADADSLQECVEMAVSDMANLSGAYLVGADLTGANLSKANLSRADLTGANLSGADIVLRQVCERHN